MNGKKDMVVFVKLDDYNELKDVVNLVKERISQAKYLIGAIAELKRKEDAEMSMLSEELSSVEERVGAIDRVLAEPEM